MSSEQAATFEPAPHGAAGTRIADQIRESILAGEYEPGARIRQEDLADRHGASRLPVREALRALEGEGLVTVVANTGAWVSRLSLAECEETYQMRERIEPLLAKAKLNMRTIQQFKVRLKYADGNLGLPEAAPFDTIIVAAAATSVPKALLQQLTLGGRMLLPLGTGEQFLLLIERRAEGYVETRLDSVRFVPLLSGLE